MLSLRGSRPIIAFALSAALMATAGCGGSDKPDKKNSPGFSETPVSPAVAKQARKGIADHGANVYGAFQSLIVKPQASGGFAGAGKKAAEAKAADAALYMVRELGPMKAAALSDPKLSEIAVKIDDLVPRLGGLIVRLRQGVATKKDVDDAAGSLDAILKVSHSGGVTIARDRTPKVG